MSYSLNNLLKGSVSGRAQLIGTVSVGVYSDKTNTYILVDSEGNEVPAVLLDEEVTLTATAASDIRQGMTAITSEGLVTGEKEIPKYRTAEGYRLVTKGSQLAVPHTDYDYTKFQAIVCAYNTNTTNSVAAKQVVILDHVYDVNSTTALSAVTKDATNSRVDLGIKNDSSEMRIIRYFMYKEIE